MSRKLQPLILEGWAVQIPDGGFYNMQPAGLYEREYQAKDLTLPDEKVVRVRVTVEVIEK